MIYVEIMFWLAKSRVFGMLIIFHSNMYYFVKKNVVSWPKSDLCSEPCFGGLDQYFSVCWSFCIRNCMISLRNLKFVTESWSKIEIMFWLSESRVFGILICLHWFLCFYVKKNYASLLKMAHVNIMFWRAKSMIVQ